MKFLNKQKIEYHKILCSKLPKVDLLYFYSQEFDDIRKLLPCLRAHYYFKGLKNISCYLGEYILIFHVILLDRKNPCCSDKVSLILTCAR